MPHPRALRYNISINDNTHTQIYSFCNWHSTAILSIKKLFEAGIRSHQRLARSQAWMQGKFAITRQAVGSVRLIRLNLWNWWRNSSSNKGSLATCGVHNSRSSRFTSGLVFWLDVHKICTSNHWKTLEKDCILSVEHSLFVLHCVI